METDTIHPAEAYLRNENNPSSLYVKIEGKRRRLFINRNENVIGIIALGKRKRGYVFTNWTSIEKIYYPSQKQEADTDGKLAHADLEKSLYENGITTGTRIDGKCIRLSTIGKYCGMANIQLFRQAMKEKKSFSSFRFDFCGYDGTLWCEPRENGDMAAGFSKEFRNCGNGYYYLLINNEYMIGYDID